MLEVPREVGIPLKKIFFVAKSAEQLLKSNRNCKIIVRIAYKISDFLKWNVNTSHRQFLFSD